MSIQKKKVLIVEDHISYAEGISLIINKNKDLFCCGIASTIEDALQQIQKQLPDIVIVDMSLKNNESGISLILEINKYFEDVAILVLTMHHELHFFREAMKAGAHGYILKDQSITEIITAIHTILQGDTYIAEELKELYLKNSVIKNTEEKAIFLNRLSLREREVLFYIGEGIGIKEIAEKLDVSQGTISSYLNRLKKKLEIDNIKDLMIFAIENKEK